MEKVVEVYRKLAQVPTVVGARIYPKNNLGNVIQTVWSQRNLETETKKTFAKCYFIDNQFSSKVHICTLDVSNELASVTSQSQQYRAVLNEITKKSETKQILEIWSNDNLQRSVDLSSLAVHGSIYTDVEFKTFDFSPSEKQLLYIAEKKSPKTEAFYKRKPAKNGDGDSSNELENESKIFKGEEYTYKQDWGEQLVGKVQSVIALYDIETDSVSILDKFPEDLCPGQVKWTKDGDSLIGIAYRPIPRKLGLYACSSRQNELFSFNIADKTYTCLSNENRSVRAPRISPTGDCVVWLERPVGGPHHCCMSLMRLKLPVTSESKPEILIDVVNDVKLIKNDHKFYGIYSYGLPSRCFSDDGKYLFFSTPQQTRIISYRLQLGSGEIEELEIADNSVTILDVYNSILAAVISNFKQPNLIVVAPLSNLIQEKKGLSKTLKLNEPFKVSDLDHFKCEDLYFKQDTSDAVTDFNGIYFGPVVAEKKSVPIILYIHGGPHGNFVNSYALSLALHASLGFATLLVNFRGSTGTGQNSVTFLPSRVGDADVKDCVLAIQECLKKYPELDESRVALMGGSHGGFLVTHISGQYPDMFRAVVARNPVTDIASMYIVSDIPDWCSVEAGTEYTQVGPLSESLMLKQRESSPLVHAHKVKAPTLLLIGSKDLRVPPSQGIEFYHRLKANGVQVRMNMYEDNHSLANVPVELDSQINGMLWIMEHTS